MSVRMRRGVIALAMAVMLMAWRAPQAAPSGAVVAAAPDLSGVWLIDKAVDSLRTDAGELPPMTSWAQGVYGEHLAARRSGNIAFDTTESHCAAPGVPRVMTLPYPFEILQADDQLLFLFGWNFLYRWVPLASGEPKEPDYPTAMGTSVAHREGMSLVIETIGRTEDTLLDAAGLPSSYGLHVSERLTLRDGGRRLENRIHIEDSKAFSRPWDSTVTYHRLPRARIQEDVCVARMRTGGPALQPGRWVK